MFAENEKALAFAQHCIGLDHKNPYKRHGRYFYRPYRNYYDASIKDCETWKLLVQEGYAEAGRKDRYGVQYGSFLKKWKYVEDIRNQGSLYRRTE